MDSNKRQLLERYHKDIISDLEVKFILSDLFTKHAVSGEEYDEIASKTDRVEQTQHLLKILIRNGTNESYEAFVDSLAKDYKWLWEKLVIENNNPMANDSFEDSLNRGDVPRLPEHHVRRLTLENNVAVKLKQLTRHKMLVFHGMSGSGKTCVAISVLRSNPDLITNDFKGVVFWLNLGNCRTDDDIVSQQNKLLRKASSICTFQSNSFMSSSLSMSSIGSNADINSLSGWISEDIRDKLKSQFLKEPLKDSLLVLDEVNEKKCVEAFDIGCKILITTRDTDVVANYHPQIVKIENSFEEKESMQIFALCLDVPVSSLPWQARKLHEICKGSPFHIGLLAAQLAENKERLIHNPDRWNYYLKKLKKKEYFFKLSRNHQTNPMKTIEMCINSLNENIITLFKKLKILPDNVQVSAEVLSKLWNKKTGEVESIMKELKSKSLIMESYDREQGNYMYEIHDLIMSYLRSTDDEDSKKLNDEFLNSYQYNNTTNPPLDIIDDGYIAFYIGYHIKNTENLNSKYNLFNKLYTDLKFLGNKVRLTGAADVLLDLQNYEEDIVKDDLDRMLINNIRGYLNAYGRDLHHYPCTDIVQSILQHESKDILYHRAIDIAETNCAKNELYFEFLHEQNVEDIKHSTIDVKENITAVCFLGNYVLIGTSQGLIKFFYIPTKKLRKELRGSSSPIKWIGVGCPKPTVEGTKSPPIVSALFYDGVVMLWRVDDLTQNDSDGTIEEETEESYNNNYSEVETVPLKLGPYVSCRWSNNEHFLIMITQKMIICYDPSLNDHKKIFKTISFDRDDLLCCVPCNNDKYLIVATYGDPSYVHMIDFKTKENVINFEETDVVLDMVTVPGSNKIITLKSNEVMEYEVKINANALKSNNTFRSRQVIASDQLKDNLKFMSIAVNKTGTLLFVSTDDSRVVCVDLRNYTSFDLENSRGNVVAMATSEMISWDELGPGLDVLLTGTGTIDDSAKVWYLDDAYVSQKAQKKLKARLTTKFDVSFLHVASPHSPGSSTTSSGAESTVNTPKRHQSFANHKEMVKKVLKNTLSLDRHTLPPLRLKGIGNNDRVLQPLLAVVDDKNNIQVMRGRKVITTIAEKPDVPITRVKISPCNQYIIYGLKSGAVKRFTLRTKETSIIMDVYSPVSYLNFVNTDLLIVAGKNRCLMAYGLSIDNSWKVDMLQKGTNNLGSQELLNELQGVKKTNGQPENMSNSSSEASFSSRERLFPSSDSKRLCKVSSVVDCFWLPELGLITVEYNATVKLWNKSMKLATILNPRHSEVHISSAALQNNILVICDKYNKGFQTFELKVNVGVDAELHMIQEYRLNNEIISCDLTTDGNILAMGLDSGNVVVWNVKGKRQLTLLKHHKHKVYSCSFSPLPERVFRSSAPHTPAPAPGDQPPLVLVTMAAEIVWWNITHLLNARAYKNIRLSGYNVLTPVSSPMDFKNDQSQSSDNGNTGSSKCNFFFGDSHSQAQECWKTIWKGKTYKEGSKRKEILACIKLTGMNAKALHHDDKFSCFVTVDIPGHVHIMNVMESKNT